MPVLENFDRIAEEIRRERPQLPEKEVKSEALDRLAERYGEEVLRALVERARRRGWEIWVIPPPEGLKAPIALGIERGKWTLKIGLPAVFYEFLGTIVFARGPWTIEQAADFFIDHEYGHQRLAPAKVPFAPVATYESMIASLVEDVYIDRFLLKGLSKEIMEREHSAMKEMILREARPPPTLPAIIVTLRTLTLPEIKKYWEKHKVIIDAKEALERMRRIEDVKPTYDRLLKLLWRYRP